MLTKSAVKKLATTVALWSQHVHASSLNSSETLWEAWACKPASETSLSPERHVTMKINCICTWQVLRKRFWRSCPQAGTPLNSIHCWMSGGSGGGYWLFCTRHSVCKTGFVWLVSKWGSPKKNQRGCSGECQKLCEHVDCYDFLSEIMMFNLAPGFWLSLCGWYLFGVFVCCCCALCESFGWLWIQAN